MVAVVALVPEVLAAAVSAPDGGCGRMVVDAETTPEFYATSRECLQRAMAHVI